MELLHSQLLLFALFVSFKISDFTNNGKIDQLLLDNGDLSYKNRVCLLSVCNFDP